MELIEIARKSIENYFEGKRFFPDAVTRKIFGKKKASFVTLTKKGKLRGCIGSLDARQELWKDVMENAINASFNDYRFLPLTKKELTEIKIEVSVLSDSKKISFKNSEELLKKINNNFGIILQKGNSTSTFLPQVWEQIPDKIKFLEELSLKAGLLKDAWKNAEIFYYSVKKFEE